jgi:iron complex transport system ATP-binding protein
VKLGTDHLTIQYSGAARPALDGVTLSIPSGCLTAVLGPNGSGKSTLLRALLGVRAPSTGTATLGERDVSAWDRRELARAVGVVAQSETVAFPITVREMVAMGRFPHRGPLRSEGWRDREAIDKALARCDIGDLRNRQVTTLSGGELQRVRIARALAQEPQALVLDEPTASLDLRHEMSILKLLRDWTDGGMTVLLITHQLNLAARFADRMIILDRGHVAAEGTPSEVFSREILERVYGWPVRVDEDPVTGSLRVVPLS